MKREKLVTDLHGMHCCPTHAMLGIDASDYISYLLAEVQRLTKANDWLVESRLSEVENISNFLEKDENK